ncbi:hypothetical protein BDV26DRAFT_253051 [Aspergillus bertholletiae]|uniref:Rhodopsin domain-containing protein n=1 Tax=Aspergillus bertholletiae TaxID=1226010 RepID=A0A5N7BLQ3_9EURO|nr:hypothetical protein BDV26DRAFT_253051 [Aspergillus bertholletiae]
MPGGIHPPLEVIASWPKANTTNPESRGSLSIILAGVFGGLALVAVGVRFWARCVIQRRAGWDDLFAALSAGPIVGLMVVFVLSSEVYGGKLHTWDNTLPNLIGQRKMAFIMEILYVIGSGLLRVSVLLFYRRMGFREVSRCFVIATWICIATIIGYSLAFFAVIFGSCQPLHAYWDQVNPVWAASHPWKCYNEPIHILVATSVALVQDVVVTTLPAILCWKLEISLREKIALGSIFFVGYLTAVISAVRQYFVVKTYYLSYDTTWVTWYCWMMGMLELLIALTCSSLPAARVFFHRYRVSIGFVGSIKSVFTKSTTQQSTSVRRSTQATLSTVNLTQPDNSKDPMNLTSASVEEGVRIELDQMGKAYRVPM